MCQFISSCPHTFSKETAAHSRPHEEREAQSHTLSSPAQGGELINSFCLAQTFSKETADTVDLMKNEKRRVILFLNLCSTKFSGIHKVVLENGSWI